MNIKQQWRRSGCTIYKRRTDSVYPQLQHSRIKLKHCHQGGIAPLTFFFKVTDGIQFRPFKL